MLRLVQAVNDAEAECSIAEELVLDDAVDALPDALFIEGLLVLLRLIYVAVAQHVHHFTFINRQ